MNLIPPDQLIADDDWSDLRNVRELPDIDHARLHEYRMGRIKQQMELYEVDVFIMVNPLSLRYAINYRSYAIFSMHVPCTYLFVSLSADYLLHNTLDPTVPAKNHRPGHPISHFYGGNDLTLHAEKFADDVVAYLSDIGSTSKRVAIEYVNPSITAALKQRGIDVVDGVLIIENARLIKSADEIECMRWAIQVAEHGAERIKHALKPGVTEHQLWGLLNYVNLVNDGDWHEGRMLASGPRTNPWLQEATDRKIESGDLVGFDTDMVGPFGYCADLSRTFHCGPATPTARQKELYQFAVEEIDFNLALVKHGMSFEEFYATCYDVPKEFQQNAYVCTLHGIGMCDEFPHLNPRFRAPLPNTGQLEEGMTVCIESYMGAVGEPDGVKLEQQVLVTSTGYELLTTYPYEEDLL